MKNFIAIQKPIHEYIQVVKQNIQLSLQSEYTKSCMDIFLDLCLIRLGVYFLHFETFLFSRKHSSDLT